MNQYEGRDRFELSTAFELPQNMKNLTEAGFDQARKAFDSLMNAAQKTASTIEDQGAAAQASARELAGKAAGFAEINIRAQLDHAERLSKARDMAEIMRLHADHLQSQMRALTDQASEMQAMTRAAMEITRH